MFYSKFLFPKESTTEENLEEKQKAFPSDSKCETFASMNDTIVSEIKELIADAEIPGGLAQQSIMLKLTHQLPSPPSSQQWSNLSYPFFFFMLRKQKLMAACVGAFLIIPTINTVFLSNTKYHERECRCILYYHYKIFLMNCYS